MKFGTSTAVGMALGLGLVLGGAAGAWIASGAVAQAQQPMTTVVVKATPRPVTHRRQKNAAPVIVVRLSDKSFVVVKDHGEAQTTMYFDVDAGFPVLKGGAKKYFYDK